jgi:hypothetical protein
VDADLLSWVGAIELMGNLLTVNGLGRLLGYFEGGLEAEFEDGSSKGGLAAARKPVDRPDWWVGRSE